LGCGFAGWAVRGFCLLQGEGQRDRRLDEVEGLALGGGGVADLVEGGSADCDGGAGEGGEVVDEAAEATHDLPVGAGVGCGLGVCVRGAAGRGDGVGSGGWLFVGVGEGGQGLAQVPGEVGGEHADQHVGADPVLQPVVDGAQVQVVGLDGPEVPFDAGDVLVAGDGRGGVQLAFGDRGADDVDAVERGLGVEGGQVAALAQAVIADVEDEVLSELVLVHHPAGPDADLVRALDPPRRDLSFDLCTVSFHIRS